ncbi:MAG: hypothetical protein OXG05_05350 [Gammaproteobacteria bacterium]|nr:hypothetical protein [Gammaproteobacteria bacterium]
MELELVVVIVVVTFTTVGFVIGIYYYISARFTQLIDMKQDKNNNEQAKQELIRMVSQARTSLIIHDDGDCNDRTFYNDDEVIEAFRQRLNSSKFLKIKCLFNVEQSIKFTNLANEFRNRVKIWYVKDGDNRLDDEIHYKIVDGGRMMYLSMHDMGEDEREYELWTVNVWPLLGVRKYVSKDQRRHFNNSIKKENAKLLECSN